MEENNKKKLSLILTIIALLLLVVGATYAYFAAQTDGTAQTNVDITAESVDSLTFSTGEAINISATLDNFGEGKGNRVGTTSATASLIAGKDSNASYNYYVYLDIEENSFRYTTSEKEAELALKVTGPDGAVTTIPGLTYNETLGGFDITEESGIIRIAENKEIATTTTKIEEWEIEVTFINLSTNQTGNNGATLKSSVKIQREKEETLAEHIISTYGSDPMLLLHDENLENGANDGSYRYSGENYRIAPAHQTEYRNIEDTNVDANGIIKFYCEYGEDRSFVGKLCTDKWNQYYYLAYDESQVHYDTYLDAIAQAINDGYIESLINNYVCFGSDAEKCPHENLYRIIGVFNNRVKLIKADFTDNNAFGTDGAASSSKLSGSTILRYRGNYKKIDSLFWIDNKGTPETIDRNFNYNDWNKSELNNINLNGHYLNSLGVDWNNKIDTILWSVSGGPFEGMSATPSTAKNAYDFELGSNKIVNSNLQDFKGKIGLMYVNEYYYAASQKYWLYPGVTNTNYPNIDGHYGGEYDYTSAVKDNWLYTGIPEWTISRESTFGYNLYAFCITATGYTYRQHGYGFNYGVRPAFYLKSNIKYISGTGTELNPFRIA